MRTSTLAMTAVFALATAQVSFAQQSQEPRRAQPPAAATETVSDADLETFATIYVDLLDTAAKLDAEMSTAATEEQAREIQGRAQTESIAKVAQRGWTPEKFNTVGDAINRDPALTDKAVKLIESK
jgi:uncharacterized protein HemX